MADSPFLFERSQRAEAGRRTGMKLRVADGNALRATARRSSAPGRGGGARSYTVVIRR
jgi:hypothetical protein